MENKITVFAAMWIVISPFVFGYTEETARSNDIITGTIIGTIALTYVIVSKKPKKHSGFLFLFGIWLIISPFLLQYTQLTAMMNDIFMGIFITIVSLVNVANINGNTLSWDKDERDLYEE